MLYILYISVFREFLTKFFPIFVVYLGIFYNAIPDANGIRLDDEVAAGEHIKTELTEMGEAIRRVSTGIYNEYTCR